MLPIRKTNGTVETERIGRKKRSLRPRLPRGARRRTRIRPDPAEYLDSAQSRRSTSATGGVAVMSTVSEVSRAHPRARGVVAESMAVQRSGTGSSPHKQGGVANPKIRIDRMSWARIRPHKQGGRTAAGQMRCVPKQPARTTLVHRQVHDVVRPKRPPTSSPPRTSPASSAQRSASIGAMTLHGNGW